MSTAGRVLTILVALAIIGWIFLIASVANLNRNWGRELDRLDASVARLGQEIDAAQGKIHQNLADIRGQQELKDRELTVLRAEISKLAKLEAADQQTLNDLQLQVKQVADATRDAEAARQQRTAEKAQTEQQLATAQAEVQNLQVSVDALIKELRRLQESFITTLQDNQRMLQQLRGRSAELPRVRPASYVR